MNTYTLSPWILLTMPLLLSTAFASSDTCSKTFTAPAPTHSMTISNEAELVSIQKYDCIYGDFSFETPKVNLPLLKKVLADRSKGISGDISLGIDVATFNAPALESIADILIISTASYPNKELIEVNISNLTSVGRGIMLDRKAAINLTDAIFKYDPKIIDQFQPPIEKINSSSKPNPPPKPTLSSINKTCIKPIRDAIQSSVIRTKEYQQYSSGNSKAQVKIELSLNDSIAHTINAGVTINYAGASISGDEGTVLQYTVNFNATSKTCSAGKPKKAVQK